MALQRQRGSNKTRGLCKLAIDVEMTIYVIDALKDGISNELESYKRIELNLGQVEEIDSAGIQLLLALKNELSRTNKQFKLTAVSGPVAQLLDIYNLTEHFGLGVAA